MKLLHKKTPQPFSGAPATDYRITMICVAVCFGMLVIAFHLAALNHEVKRTNALLEEQIRLWHQPRTDSVHFVYPLYPPYRK